MGDMISEELQTEKPKDVASDFYGILPAFSTPPHKKARTDHPQYVEAGMRRIFVPDDKVSWTVE